LGFVKWYESDNNTERYAPLILIPVSLERATGNTFFLQYDDTEVITNLSLSEKAKEFDINLPNDTEDLNLPNYFAQVMYKDLEPDNWSIGTHPVLGSILSQNSIEPATSLPADEQLDKVRPVEHSLEIYDAGSSQIMAILQAKSAPLTVIQGPPGTGKSQTITNIIAEAVWEGKKVLFVSEKRATLEVVWRRLHEAGLSQICIELHSSKAHKAQFYAELQKTLQEAPSTSKSQQEKLKRLEGRRDYLNKYCDALHTPVDHYGLTPFQCIAQLCGLRAQKGKYQPNDFQAMSGWTQDDFENACSLVERLQTHNVFFVRGCLPAS